MKFKLSYFCLVAATLLTACTPAHLVRPASVPEDSRSEIVIFRVKEFNASGMSLVFSANGQEVALLDGGDSLSLFLPVGENKISARSTQGDKPFQLSILAGKNQRHCIKASADPDNIGKAFIPLMYLVSSTFILEERSCPTDDELSKFKKLTVKYGTSSS